MLRTILVAALLISAAPLGAQAPTLAAQAAPSEAVARAFFDVVATGDPARIRSFITANFSPKAAEFEPTDVFVKRVIAFAEQSGGIDITEWQASPDTVRYAGLTRKGRLPVRGLIGLHEGKPLGLQVSRDLRVRGADAPTWPTSVASPQEALKAIQREVDWQSRADRFSGTVLVAYKGKIMLDQAWGLARRSPDAGNTPDTRFHTASMTKMLTAAAVGQLIDAGKLSLDTPVGKAVPALAGTPGASQTTIRDLLGHRVSYGDYISQPEYRRRERDGATATELLKLVEKPEPIPARPGRIFYSNTNYLILGAAIEAATGLSYYDYVQQRLLKPLGMSHTTYGSASARPDGAAIGWIKDEDADPLGLGPWLPNDNGGPYRGGPPGGAWSTSRDIWRFLDALAAGKVVKPATLAAMMSDLRTGARTFSHGLGFMVNEANERRFFGHDGGGPNAGISTAAFTSADGDWSVVVLSNYSSPSAESLGKAIMDFVLSATPKAGAIAS